MKRSVLVVLVLTVVALLASCSSATSPASDPAASSEPSAPVEPGVTASPSPTAEAEVQYALPKPAAVCKAARRSEVEIVKTTPEKEFDSHSCDIDVKSNSDKVPYDLNVEFRVSPGGGLDVKTMYDQQKDTDWNRSHSPFSGAASKRADVLQVGDAKAGEQYDEAYYAFYPDHAVAGSHTSESVLVLRRGNIILELDLRAGDLTGSTVSSIKPVKAKVGQQIFDQIADELIALVKPADASR